MFFVQKINNFKSNMLQNMEITIRENIEFGTQELEIFCNVQGHPERLGTWGLVLTIYF